MGLLDTIGQDLQVVRDNLTNLFLIILNIVSSISIVISNKWVFQYSGFTYGTALTILHFIMTFIGLAICAYFNMFTIKKLRILDVVPLSALFCGFVVLTNLSLQYNSVGFYQVMKVLTTPFIVFVQATYYKMTFEKTIVRSLVPLCIGVALASASDVQVNLVGTLYALVAVVVTSFYQMMIGQYQKSLGVDSMQLLFYQAPISAVMLVFIVPVFDDVEGLRNFTYTVNNVSLIFLSAALSFFVNLSIFLVIGRTSAVSYNVVGHFKLCVVIFSGFFVFGNPVQFWNMVGLLITIISVIVYTHVKLQAQTKPAPPPEKSQLLKSEDSDLDNPDSGDDSRRKKDEGTLSGDEGEGEAEIALVIPDGLKTPNLVSRKE